MHLLQITVKKKIYGYFNINSKIIILGLNVSVWLQDWIQTEYH
jgi:hypothetical protein